MIVDACIFNEHKRSRHYLLPISIVYISIYLPTSSLYLSLSIYTKEALIRVDDIVFEQSQFIYLCRK